MSSKKTRSAGILLVITAALGILAVLILSFLLWATIEGLTVGFGTPTAAHYWLVPLIFVVAVAPAAIALAGGLFSLKRRRWGWSLAGAICGLPYFCLTAIPALVLIVLSRDEYKHAGQ